MNSRSFLFIPYYPLLLQPYPSLVLLPNNQHYLFIRVTLEPRFNEKAKGLAKCVRYNEVLLYRGYFSYNLLLLKERKLVFIPSLYRSSLYRGSTVRCRVQAIEMESLGFNAGLSRFRTTTWGNSNNNNYSVSFDGPLKI